jgi:hypothetical protein
MTHEPALEYLLAMLNLALCFAIAGVCGCRLRLTSLRTRQGVRIKYAVYGAASLVFGFSPWTGEWPGWTGCVFSLSMLVGLLTSWHRWQFRAPPETGSGHAPLEATPEKSQS